MKAKTKITSCMAAISALDLALKNQILPVPEGWFTGDEFCAAKKCGKSQGNDLLLRATRMGVYERKKWKSEQGVYAFIYKLK